MLCFLRTNDLTNTMNHSRVWGLLLLLMPASSQKNTWSYRATFIVSFRLISGFSLISPVRQPSCSSIMRFPDSQQIPEISDSSWEKVRTDLFVVCFIILDFVTLWFMIPGNDALPRAKAGRLSKCLLVYFSHARTMSLSTDGPVTSCEVPPRPR